jgi:hypothetical protein
MRPKVPGKNSDKVNEQRKLLGWYVLCNKLIVTFVSHLFYYILPYDLIWRAEDLIFNHVSEVDSFISKCSVTLAKTRELQLVTTHGLLRSTKDHSDAVVTSMIYQKSQ